MGRDAHWPAHRCRRRIRAQPHAPAPRGRAGTGATGTSGQLSRLQPPGRTGPNHRRGRRRLHVRAAGAPAHRGAARVTGRETEWSSRGACGCSSTRRSTCCPRCTRRSTPIGPTSCCTTSAAWPDPSPQSAGVCPPSRSRRAWWHGTLSRGHGRSAGADARQPRLPGISNGLRRLAGTNEHVADASSG